MLPRFRDRMDAGRKLAARLEKYARRPDTIVLALPRGGVPVGFEVAQALACPLDVLVVRKLGTPGQPELAMGAIAAGGTRVLNQNVLRGLHVPSSVIEAVTAEEQRELIRREHAYRGAQPFPDVRRHVVLLVDDGLATGATMRAAVHAVRRAEPGAIVVAVPVAARQSLEELQPEVEDVVCVVKTDLLDGIGEWYADFSQTPDEQVCELLARSRSRPPVGSTPGHEDA